MTVDGLDHLSGGARDEFVLGRGVVGFEPVGVVPVGAEVDGQEPHVALSGRHVLVVGLAHHLQRPRLVQFTDDEFHLLLLEVLQVLCSAIKRFNVILFSFPQSIPFLSIAHSIDRFLASIIRGNVIPTHPLCLVAKISWGNQNYECQRPFSG